MHNPQGAPLNDRFEIIFTKLAEAKKEQDANFDLELQAASESNETILLFKEYQESMTEYSYTTFTRS